MRTAIVKRRAEAAGARSAVQSRVFAEGGAGGADLAEAVVEAAKDEPALTYLFPEDAPVEEKVRTLATKIYGADDVRWAPAAPQDAPPLPRQWLGGDAPSALAKTHLSISHNPRLAGRPSGYTFEVSDVRASVGAGFIYPVAGTMMTMPGLPGSPRALDVDAEGNILGL